MKTNKNKKQAKGKAPATKKSAVKPATTKKQNKATAATTKAKPKREIKVGDKIVGEVNGAVGIVKKLNSDIGAFGEKQNYAVIEYKDSKTGKTVQSCSSIEYLQRQAKRGGVKITTPRKTASKTSTTTQSKAKKPTAKQPAKKAGKQQDKKQGEGAKPSHPKGGNT